MTDRTEQIISWLSSQDYRVDDLQPASNDASFRSYWRATTDQGVYIVMDAPPENEDCRPFVKIGRELLAMGLNVPEILAEDLVQGFLLLGDLGTQPYLDALHDESAERLYGDAINALVTLQTGWPSEVALPSYDAALLNSEMELFRTWFLEKHLELRLDAQTNTMLGQAFALLAQNALSQPQVCVHRDYHSRNLMLTDRNNPGILDFQDAVMGPVTYDLVSLLRDCYITWPHEQVRVWAMGYYELAMQSGILNRDQHHDAAQFMEWFDLMGVQRHLKAIGIFSRLNHRDGKAAYLDDIPRTLNYIETVSGNYAALSELQGFITERVALALEASL